MSRTWTILTILAFLTIFSSSISTGNGQEYDDDEVLIVESGVSVRSGMSNSNPQAGRTLVALTMKYTTRAAFCEVLKLLRVFLIVRTILIAKYSFLYQFLVDFEKFSIKCR